MAQVLTNVDDFLLYLAKKANPKRFYPFPDKYRLAAYKKDDTCSDGPNLTLIMKVRSYRQL
jgi:hypothetical protein